MVPKILKNHDSMLYGTIESVQLSYTPSLRSDLDVFMSLTFPQKALNVSDHAPTMQVAAAKSAIDPVAIMAPMQAPGVQLSSVR